MNEKRKLCVCVCVYANAKEYDCVLKEILSFATTRVKLEDITLTAPDMEWQILWFHLYAEPKKQNL